MTRSRRGSAAIVAGTGQGRSQRPRPARQCRFGLSDHVNPAHNMGPGDPYVNSSHPLSP
jgi:hypothetical protein